MLEHPRRVRRGLIASLAVAGVAVAAIAAVAAIRALIPMTQADFHLSGTQIGDVPEGVLGTSGECRSCHGDFDTEDEPWATWAGSLMGLAGRDPLFFAQMTTANQDVANVGTFCLRCHVPMSYVTGHASDPTGASLDEVDRDGVTCHFCHSQVDPVYVAGQSPPEDAAVLDALAEVPTSYANAMFVLDPQGVRRGPYADTDAQHQTIYSPFHKSGAMCGTCHDVGNVAVSKLPNGTYRYNLLDQPTADENPWMQFPLERTYTEWKLSEFAATGVDLGGRFGGTGGPVVGTCQDCHMPKTTARGCFYGRERTDLARHEFAGAAAPVLDLILEHQADDPTVDPALILPSRARSVSMLRRSATLDLVQEGAELVVRVTNQSGHKLPTGHIEGRRVWIHVRFFAAAGALAGEHGHYDMAEAHLDEASTTVFEMHVGLSDDAAAATGFPPGITTHMALADTIVKDNRIPPRGFTNAAFEAGGAPPVGTVYADGQYWSDSRFAVPVGAVRAEAEIYYQNTPRHYIDALRDGNTTDNWGQTLHDLWTATGRGAPIEIARRGIPLGVEGVFADSFESGYTSAWSAVAP
jgi:hypothetical protein